jgi:hypothetical protein
VIDLHHILHRPRVSFRRYGLRGEHLRPIVHRFDIKGGARIIDAISMNVTKCNSLLERLQVRGRR